MLPAVAVGGVATRNHLPRVIQQSGRQLLDKLTANNKALRSGVY